MCLCEQVYSSAAIDDWIYKGLAVAFWLEEIILTILARMNNASSLNQQSLPRKDLTPVCVMHDVIIQGIFFFSKVHHCHLQNMVCKVLTEKEKRNTVLHLRYFNIPFQKTLLVFPTHITLTRITHVME